ncbi:MAG: NAD(P)/FAD-dependent oxidoreductase [Luteibaculaceae bacterium]
MIEKEFALSPDKAHDTSYLHQIAAEAVGSTVNKTHFTVVKRSIDARGRQVLFRLRMQIAPNEQVLHPISSNVRFNPLPDNAPLVYIAGAGPAGLFAALELIHLGVKPIVIERGKPVRDRRRDLAELTKNHVVNTDSNYCFGEGGAGTYSDGKLYTRSTKRGDVHRVFSLFVQHGASPDILVDAHPHIGTNKLPQIITNIRETIEKCGGEVWFNTKLTNIFYEDNQLTGIEINGEKQLTCDNLILATGHSARDIFELLHREKITIEAKPFALGVRVEHPQSLIDSIQYKCDTRGIYLPAASYKLVKQVDEKGVFSFCMCPGGIIAPCATEPGEIVTNGWSPSKRNNPYANSGIVVSVEPTDADAYRDYGALSLLRFQQSVEKNAFAHGGGGQVAPAQKLTDFVTGKISNSLPDCSYLPGVKSVDLQAVLPRFIAARLQKAFSAFGSAMKGYLHPEAILVAPESRTSSPVKIPRNPITLEHVQVKGLYPCAEGAGYAGGIASAAIDGQKCAAQIAVKLGKI